MSNLKITIDQLIELQKSGAVEPHVIRNVLASDKWEEKTIDLSSFISS